MKKMTVTITDDKWPRLTMVVLRESNEGQVARTDHFMYDGAYNVFEGILHDNLRKLVEEVIRKRKGK